MMIRLIGRKKKELDHSSDVSQTMAELVARTDAMI